MGLPAEILFPWSYEDLRETWAGLCPGFAGDRLIVAPYVALSGEHLFRAMQTTNTADFRRMLAHPTPAEARADGRHLLRPRPDWTAVRLPVMAWVLSVRYTLQRDEGRALIDSGDALLTYCTARDSFWGIPIGPFLGVQQEPPTREQRGIGQNWYGRLLMARRAELVAELAGELVDYTPMFEAIRYRPATPDS